MTAPRFVLGIDLGTTNTVAAVWVETAPAPQVASIRQPVKRPDDGKELQSLPSAVGFDDSAGVLVGEYVREKLAAERPDRAVMSVKRHMGTRWTRRIRDTDWHPEGVSACILRAVRDGLVLPRELAGRDPTEADCVVVTVPACFDTEQRRATLTAAAAAGFDETRTVLFDEPTAALLYQVRLAPPDQNPCRAVVLDIGGGTLDASYVIVTRTPAADPDAQPGVTAELLGRSRYNELGGDDIDLNLAAVLLEKYLTAKSLAPAAVPDDDAFRALCGDLLAAARKAKVALVEKIRGEPDTPPAEQLQLSHPIPAVPTRGALPGWDHGDVTYADLIRAVWEFLPVPDRPAADDKYLFGVAIDQCLRHVPAADGNWPPVDVAYLTGGSSYLPVMEPAVREEFRQRGLAPQVRPVNRPLLAVALGAAVYAGTRVPFAAAAGVTVRDRMFEGVFLREAAGGFRVVLPPGASLGGPDPVVGRLTVTTTAPARWARFELFTGADVNDPALQPLPPQVVRFDAPVDAGQELVLEVTVDTNRRLDFRCRAVVGREPRTWDVSGLRSGLAAAADGTIPAVNVDARRRP